MTDFTKGFITGMISYTVIDIIVHLVKTATKEFF
jgi:hypothetical protein